MTIVCFAHTILPIFVRKEALTVFALMYLFIIETLLLDLLAQRLIDVVHRIAGILLVPPQI